MLIHMSKTQRIKRIKKSFLDKGKKTKETRGLLVAQKTRLKTIHLS